MIFPIQVAHTFCIRPTEPTEEAFFVKVDPQVLLPNSVLSPALSDLLRKVNVLLHLDFGQQWEHPLDVDAVGGMRQKPLVNFCCRTPVINICCNLLEGLCGVLPYCLNNLVSNEGLSFNGGFGHESSTLPSRQGLGGPIQLLFSRSMCTSRPRWTHMPVSLLGIPFL